MPIETQYPQAPFLLRKWRSWPSWNRWLVGIAAVLLIFAAIPTDQSPLTPTARAQAIDNLFSDKDGSNPHINLLIQSKLHEPDSYKHDITTYVDNGDHLVVTTIYTANNMFRKRVSGMAKVKLSMDGEVISVLQL
ncbi:hypothetical protein QKW35_14535 [Pontibacterium granulatum]|uniref:hypothetical protein n=1 Tax=Pontibacterium granulatum TaxID=2036029 RepID=UPI00249C091A|nr:hypothetical protein [Pontibacterium granulatum]MDI3325593.1 hypothetical protein [Pontibacterium granulatum]